MNANLRIDISWLTKRTSVEELVRECSENDLPASFREEMLARIRSFELQMADGDELWKFASPDDSWQNKCGTAGLAIRRGGEIVFTKELAMN